MHVLSGSIFCSGPGSLDSTSAPNTGEKKKGRVMEIDSCKNRNNTAGQTIPIEWHVCLGDTSLQILHKLQELMSVTGHARESFPDRIIFATTVNDITDYISKKVQGKRLDSAKEVASYAADLVSGIGIDLDAQFAGGEWDKFASVMTREFITSKVQVFNNASNMDID